MRVEKFEFLLFRKKFWGQENGATLQHYNHYNCNPRHAPCYIYNQLSRIFSLNNIETELPLKKRL